MKSEKRVGKDEIRYWIDKVYGNCAYEDIDDDVKEIITSLVNFRKIPLNKHLREIIESIYACIILIWWTNPDIEPSQVEIKKVDYSVLFKDHYIEYSVLKGYKDRDARKLKIKRMLLRGYLELQLYIQYKIL